MKNKNNMYTTIYIFGLGTRTASFNIQEKGKRKQSIELYFIIQIPDNLSIFE
jgi:hypothetical protein